MRSGGSQDFWARGGATVSVSLRMRLAPAERERLWKALERFVNCEDDLRNFQSLGRAFPSFWPVRIYYLPDSKNQMIGEPPPIPDSLTWHPVCHKLFLCYRDTLRTVWDGAKGPEKWAWPGFLLGLTNWNSASWQEAKGRPTRYWSDSLAGKLGSAWWQILAQFPEAYPVSNPPRMFWEHGEFCLDLSDLDIRSDFPKAFYSVFRQSWRARRCRRCRVRFVARKPKQLFCGTVCSAGSRLASKRKWWKRAGAKRRADQREAGATRNRRERKQR